MTDDLVKRRTPQEVFNKLIAEETDAMVITKLGTLQFAYEAEIERLRAEVNKAFDKGYREALHDSQDMPWEEASG